MGKKNEPSESFSQRLVRLMGYRNLSVRRAASIAGVPRSTIQDWRSGVHPTDFMAVQRLARALETTLSFLLTGDDETRLPNAPSIIEAFIDEGLIFDEYCQVQIRRLSPRRLPVASDPKPSKNRRKPTET